MTDTKPSPLFIKVTLNGKLLYVEKKAYYNGGGSPLMLPEQMENGSVKGEVIRANGKCPSYAYLYPIGEGDCISIGGELAGYRKDLKVTT